MRDLLASNLARLRAVFVLTGLVLVAALIAGGGTREGFIGDVLLQYLAAPIFIVSLVMLAREPGRRDVRAVIVFCILLAIVPLLQLVPLGPHLRALFPGKIWIDETYALLGREVPYWPLSMAPHATWLSLLSLIPPFAVLAGVIQLSYRERRTLCLIVIAFAVASVFLGLLQLAQGPNSALRPFEFTNAREAVGLFANRNHFAALLYAAMILSACFAVDALMARAAETNRSLIDTSGILVIAGTFLVFMVLVIAQVMTRSRAGMMLSILAMLGILAIALSDRRTRASGARSVKLIAGAAAFAVVFSMQYALYRILERFEADPLADARLVFARKTFEAAIAFLHFGSGVGTFVPVYATFEKPADMATFYANRAHNDVLESALEAGVVSLVLMAVFAFWLTRKSLKVWGSGAGMEGHRDIDHMLMKGATLVLAALAVHSFLDYPLRTAAIMCVAAFCCGLLVAPKGGQGHSGHAAHGAVRNAPRHDEAHAPSRPAASDEFALRGGHGAHTGHGPQRGRDPQISGRAAAPAASPGPAKPVQRRPFERWEGADDWPEEWRKSHEGTSHDAPPSSDGAADKEPEKKN